MTDERKIIVKDKSGKLLATFSNKTPASDKESKKELMVAPTIDIVSNGESTLTFQMFVASNNWQAIKHPENLYYCNGRVYTALNEQSIVYNGPMVTVTLVERWYLLSTKYVQAHNVNTEVESIDEHTVKILPKTDTKYQLTVDGIKYADSSVRDSRGIVMPRGSAGYALWAILKGTDWTLGVCDVLPDGFSAKNDYGTFNVESDMKDALENIKLIQSLYGGILDWDSENKVLNLRDPEKQSDFNTWKGFVVRKGKNLTEYPEVTWDNNITTRLYPLGNGNLNIAKVNGGKNYVDNFSYTKEVYEGYLQNANIYDTNDEGGQKTLKFWAEQQLKKLCRPRKSIQYSIADTRATQEYKHEWFDINDIARCHYIDTETGEDVVEDLRIVHLEYDWFYPNSESTLEVGDKIIDAVELFYQMYKSSINQAPTDANGNISGSQVQIKIPEYFWDETDGWGYFSMDDLSDLYGQHITDNEEGISQNGAAIQVTNSNLNQQIALEARHYEETSTGILDNKASIKITADALQSQVQLEASHYSTTTAGINANKASITATASKLDAQISLEASHHSESIQYTTNAVAGLKSYVNGEFASNQLKASYDYTDNKTGKVSNSLADFKQEVRKNYATIQAVASVDGKVAALKLSVDDTAGAVAELTSGSASLTLNSLSVSKLDTAAFTVTGNVRVGSLFADGAVSGETVIATSVKGYGRKKIEAKNGTFWVLAER